MSPVASVVPWAASRHHRALVMSPEPAVTTGIGSWLLDRKATLKKAGGFAAVPAPPGWVALALAAGSRYLWLALSHRPTPIAKRTVCRPGFQSECGTSTSIWRRWRSSLTVADGPAPGDPSAACTRSATSVEPDGWTVRNIPAGALTLAPS